MGASWALALEQRQVEPLLARADREALAHLGGGAVDVAPGLAGDDRAEAALTAQVSGVAELNSTGSPELALACSAKGGSSRRRAGSGAKLIAWLAGSGVKAARLSPVACSPSVDTLALFRGGRSSAAATPTRSRSSGSAPPPGSGPGWLHVTVCPPAAQLQPAPLAPR
jgi:hypothetical protein